MENLACPYCFNKFSNIDATHKDCICVNCNLTFKYNNFFHLYRNDDTWIKCLEQVIAVRRAEASDFSYQSPKTVEQEKHVVSSIDVNEEMIKICMYHIGNINGKVFLDLGGSSGWASSRFIKEGANNGYLMDIDAKLLGCFDSNIISIIGDGYFIPLIDGCLDFVFDCSALHHFEDKPEVLRQIHRVLKPGGIYVSQGNPPREGENDDDRTRYMKDFGLIETMPTRSEYENYFNEVFGNINMIPASGGNMVMHATKQRN